MSDDARLAQEIEAALLNALLEKGRPLGQDEAKALMTATMDRFFAARTTVEVDAHAAPGQGMIANVTIGFRSGPLEG